MPCFLITTFLFTIVSSIKDHHPVHRRYVPVGQRGDDETRAIAEVLVRVRDRRIDDSNVDVVLPVITKLRQPLEVHLVDDLFLDEGFDNVHRVHVDSDQSVQRRSILLRESPCRPKSISLRKLRKRDRRSDNDNSRALYCVTNLSPD